MASMHRDTTNERLAGCWRNQNCRSCTHSRHGCGWCPHSSTCVPVSSLLEPVSNKNTCPSRDERFELRTKALGCGCSTTTFLSVVVTVFATIAALALVYGLVVLVKHTNRVFGTGSWRGTAVEFKDDGSKEETEWKRHPWSEKFSSIFRRDRTSSDKSEQEQITERSRLLG